MAGVCGSDVGEDQPSVLSACGGVWVCTGTGSEASRWGGPAAAPGAKLAPPAWSTCPLQDPAADLNQTTETPVYITVT